MPERGRAYLDRGCKGEHCGVEVNPLVNEEGRGGRSTNPIHTVHLSNRESVVIHGVLHVDSFDDQEVILATELGTLTMKG